jgi:DNA-binding beta-propeller fold protein YncE
MHRTSHFKEDVSVKTHNSLRWIAGIVMLSTVVTWAQAKSAGGNNGQTAAPATAPRQALVWPLSPDLPRVRWLEEYTDMAKIKNPGAKKHSWLEKLAGVKTEEETQALRKPYGITTDSWGRIYVADTQLKVVFMIDPEAKAVERWGGTSQAPMALPAGVAVDAENRLFVSDAQLCAITCFSPTGDVVARFGMKELGRPGGIAVDRRRNRLFVADAKENRIAVFDTRKLKLLGYLGRTSTSKKPEPGVFSGPTNVAVDLSGNIYVADTLNCRVQVLDPAGKFLHEFGKRGSSPGEFIRPKGIAVDSEGHVYVADAEFNNFQIFTKEGQPLLAVGSLGVDAGEFGLIAGLHIDERDRIYTTEMYVGRIQVFQYIPQPESEGRKGVVNTINLLRQDTGTGK